MLILVGVTINVALNGGLFTQAQDAASDTQKAAEREQLLSAVVTAYDTKTGLISQSKLESNLGTDWRVDGTEGGPYTVTSPKGNVFTVDTKGNITDINGNGNGEPTSETYTFTIGELVKMEGAVFDNCWRVPFENFWKEGVSENLKNSTIERNIGSATMMTYNVSCLEEGWVNYFDIIGTDTESFSGFVFLIGLDPDNGLLESQFMCISDGECTSYIDDTNWETYKDLTFTISIADSSSSSDAEVDQTLARYLLGPGLAGRNIGNIVTVNDNGTYLFTDDETTADVDENQLGVAWMLADNSSSIWYLKYNNKAYSIKLEIKDGTLVTKKGTLSLVYEPKGEEGQTYEFNGETWTVLYDEDGYKEILSPNVLGNLDLVASELDTAINNYNNAIYLINEHCKDQISDSLASDDNVRSVGGANETKDMFTSEKYDLKNNGDGKEGDSLFLNDLIRMTFYGVEKTGTSYWIASRVISGRDTDHVDYDVRICNNWGWISSKNLWYSGTDKSNTTNTLDSYGVRPIVKIMK